MPSTLLTAAYFLSMIMVCRAFYSWNSLSCQKKALHYSRHLAISATQGSIEYLQEVLLLRGSVTNGYGRGSKKLGVPTANLPHFDKEIKDSKLTNGVYYGWGYLPSEGEVLGCVVNIGKSPTFVDEENRVNIVEAHLLDRTVNSTSDFYGKTLKLCLVGFMRPEKKFESFAALIAQINADIQLGRDFTSSTDVDGPLGTGRELARNFFESTEDSQENDLIWKRIKNA